MSTMMTEVDVSHSARKYILDNFWEDGQAKYISEATQYNLKRPDMLVFVEYQSLKRQWVVHSIESKVDRRYLTVSDLRKVCSGVKQGRSYKANYRWLAISKEVYNDLIDYEWRKLVKDCKGTVRNTGLLIAYKTKVDMSVQAGYYPGSWFDHYIDENWLLEELE